METVEKQIIIKPVVKSKFSGISAHSNTKTAFEGAQLAKGGYKTGLTREEEKNYEDALNLPKGTLRRDNKEFWGNVLNLSLPNDKAYYFVVNSPMDELKLKVILEHSGIANNELELLKNPTALFYIEDKEAKAKIEEISINYKMEASDAFAELTSDEKAGYLKVMTNKKGIEDLSERIVKTELFKEMEKDPKKFLDLTKDPDINLRISIEEMMQAGTLTRKGSYYQFENEIIGNSVDAVIAFFKDLKNQSIKIAAEQVTKKKK